MYKTNNKIFSNTTIQLIENQQIIQQQHQKKHKQHKLTYFTFKLRQG